MEGRSYTCDWKKEGPIYKLWVRNRPQITAQARTFEKAEEGLGIQILESLGDGEPVWDYVTPPPVSIRAKKYLTPSLVSLCGDSFPDESNPKALFIKGTCKKCGLPLGKRSDTPLFIGYTDPSYEGGFLYGMVKRYYFSDKFLKLLTKKERSDLKFGKAKRSPKAKKVFFELQGEPKIPFVGIKNVESHGWRCGVCGKACFSNFKAGIEVGNFIRRSYLPKPLPDCFVIGSIYEPHLCMTQERWMRIVGKPGARGIISQPIGVVDDIDCVRVPKLKAR